MQQLYYVNWFGYLQLIGPQSLGSVFVVSLCAFERVTSCGFRDASENAPQLKRQKHN